MLGEAGGNVELQAQPWPIMHLSAQLMQLLPQAQVVLGQTMQQPVESSWHPARNKNAAMVKMWGKRGTVTSILDDRFVFV